MFHKLHWPFYSLALYLPVASLCFFLSAPHSVGTALAFTVPVWLLIALDHWGPDEQRVIPSDAPDWFFDGLIYLLVALQITNVLALGLMVSRLTWTGAEAVASMTDLVVLRILYGTTACCAVICPAHELIHRRQRWQRWLGRVLLMTVFYDHFHIAHKAGHHARLGSRDDPSTALPDESYGEFCRRSLIQQWCLAWSLQPRTVMQGLLAQAVFALAFGLAFGPLALFALGYVAGVGIRLLEAVNYFQHFALTLASGRSVVTAWRSDSAVSLFLFLGLNRHADHHRRPAVAYHQLIALDDGPCLPCGYLGTAIWVKNASGSFRRWALSEAGLGGDRYVPVPETGNGAPGG